MKEKIILVLKSWILTIFIILSSTLTYILSIYNSGIDNTGGLNFMPKWCESAILIVLITGSVSSMYFICKKNTKDIIIAILLGIIQLYILDVFFA